jgi:nitrate/TMAO reductase-like tetraheme cytochrome c subunit
MSNDQPQGARPVIGGGWRKLAGLCNNPLSVLGLLCIGLSLTLLIAFTAFSAVSEEGNPYLDIIGYMVLPGVFVFGLVVVPIGAIWKRRWLRKHGSDRVPRHVQIDLNDRPTRGAILIFLTATFFIVLPGLAVSGYEGYIYSESTEFCAKVCHTVMEPQGTAHADSAHARVSCAACHIGEGAGWFVKSKLSGTRQVLAVWRDSFHRPIPPAITELRPARETCEECHWPARFFGSQLRKVVHYAPDEQNTRRVVRMLLKTGGANEALGRVEGIHMHMLVSGRIEFVATDEHLQEIPWVRFEREDGTATVYRSDGQPHDAPPPAGTRRTIDCMDCHNRGAHHFLPPQRAVDQQLEAGRIDADLPWIKREAVAALVAGYGDDAAASDGIATALRSFYREQHPDVAQASADAIENAIASVQDVYRRSFFPAMKVTWETYPENIGHMISPGCFRCHDGLHVDPAGRPINSDCTVCHTFLNAVPGTPGQFREGRFEHSMSLQRHAELRCSQCHDGGRLQLCRDCHADLRGLDRWDDTGRLRRPGS